MEVFESLPRDMKVCLYCRVIDLRGKTAVITGASRGVGEAIAKECLALGMQVSVCARTQPSPDIEPSDNYITMAVDVADEEAVNRLTAHTVERFGSIDLWVNNAGVLDPISPLRDLQSSDLQAHLAINLMGVFHGTKSFIHHLRSRSGEGVLLNISSGASTSGYAGWGAYCAGKAAVDRLTEVAQLEEADSGLRAYSVAPGIIDTDMQSLIRSCTEEQFPAVEKFRQLKKDDAFSGRDYVAKELLKLAFDQSCRPENVCARLEAE